MRIEFDGAGSGFDESHEDGQEGAFAGSVRAQKARDLALVDVQRQTPNRPSLLPAPHIGWEYLP